MDVADYVMFTGSTASGRTIAQEAGRRLVDCSLELGGKNAMLVLDDADVDRAVEGAVRACFSSSGQLCISVERMYVADGIYDSFMPRFLEAVQAMRMGASYDFEHQMGSLTSAEQLEVTRRHVDDAVAAGATLLAGGHARPELGPYFFEPTVLTDVSPAMTCFAEETFGPVVSVYRFSTDDEAIDRANDTRYGLNASVWSRSAAPRAGSGGATAGRDGERQRGLRRGVGQHRRPDGRHGRLGHGPPPRRPGPHQVHRGPDRRPPAAVQPGATVPPTRRRRLRLGDDHRPARC